MSIRMKAVAFYLRARYKPRLATAERARALIDAPKGDPSPPARLTGRHRVNRRTDAGFDCYTVTARTGPTPPKAVIYLHGGAYINEITKRHWRFVSRLADAGLRVEVPLYGLAPRYSHREAFPFVTAVYRDLLETYDPQAVSLAGDSAGGGLALAVTQTLIASGLPRPGRLILISPWLDLTLSNPAIAAVEPHDPWLTGSGLIEAGRAWADGTDPADPRLSPVNGDLTRLPPVDIHTGTHDILHPDAVRLRDRAPDTAEVTLHTVPGAFHVHVLAPVPEARHATRQITRTLRNT
ncbi:MAG TPA: alpha/beta hydrolase [Thermomonospora sp.]|nr:alpha/beta hydrolase [Thermomonospora sp.]